MTLDLRVDLLGLGTEFGFGAEPIRVWIAGGAVAFEIDLIGAKGDLFVCWF